MAKKDKVDKQAKKKANAARRDEEKKRMEEEENRPVDIFEIRNGYVDPKNDIQVHKAKIAYGGNLLLKAATFTLAYGRRYGLVGKNGTGKSSLMRAMAEGECPGIPKGMDTLYVAQECIAGETKALDIVLSADWERELLLKEEQRLLDIPELSQEDAERMSKVYSRLDEIKADSAPARAAAILSGLQFTEEMQQWPTKEFSGGWRMRLSLARALFREPTLLMLDEPTNHLDLHASIWLEDYLSRYPKSLFIISHDKDVLDAVTTDTLHLINQDIVEYKGNFTLFCKIREEHEREQRRLHENQTKEIAHLKDVIQRTRGNASTAGAASSRKKALAKMEIVDDLAREREVLFEFPDCGELSHPVLRFHDATFGYSPDKIIYKDLDFGIDLKSRVALVGPNGTGKTTLLNLFSGELTPLVGEVEQNKFLRIAKYSQHGVDELNLLECSAVQYMHNQFPRHEKKEGKTLEETIRAHLGRYGLSGQLAIKPVYQLSGGQKARLTFAWIAWKEPHLLLLDEPTNHLDMDSIDALIDGVAEFKGGVILVSHNAYLIDQVCNEIWVCGRDKTAEIFEGTFQDYKSVLVKQMKENALQLDFEALKL